MDTGDAINKILSHLSVFDGFKSDFYSRETAFNERITKGPVPSKHVFLNEHPPVSYQKKISSSEPKLNHFSVFVTIM